MTIHVPGCPSSIAHALSYLPVGEGVLYVAPSTWLAAFDQGVNHFFTVSWALSSHHQFTKFYVTHGFFHTSASWLQAYKYPTMESYSCTCELLIHCILTWAMVVHWSPPHAKSMCLLISDMLALCKSLSIIHFTFTSLIISWCCFGLFWTSQNTGSEVVSSHRTCTYKRRTWRSWCFKNFGWNSANRRYWCYLLKLNTVEHLHSGHLDAQESGRHGDVAVMVM